MTAQGGSIQDITVKARLFPVAADSDSTRDLGGFSVENAMNGNGTVRPIKTRKAWSIEGLTISIDDDNGDQEFLQDLMDSGEQVPITVTYVSGATWEGRGGVTGDLGYSSQSATASPTFSGGLKLKKQ